MAAEIDTIGLAGLDERRAVGAALRAACSVGERQSRCGHGWGRGYAAGATRAACHPLSACSGLLNFDGLPLGFRLLWESQLQDAILETALGLTAVHFRGQTDGAGERPTRNAAGLALDGHSYDYEDLVNRDKASLDIFWLRDESLSDSDNLPAPEVIAAEIVEDLEAALEQFREILGDMGPEAAIED